MADEKPKDRQISAALIAAGGAIIAALIAAFGTAHSPTIINLLNPSTSPSQASGQTPVATQGSPVSSSGLMPYHEAMNVSVPANQNVDLDADPTDRQWGMVGTPATKTDFYWDPQGIGDICIRALCPTDGAIVPDNSDGSTCANFNGDMGGAQVPVARIRKGVEMCFLTDSGRYSLIKVDRDYVSPDVPLLINITTFKKEGD